MVSLIFVIFLAIAVVFCFYKAFKEDSKEDYEQSSGLLVAMHTHYKASGEDKKAAEVSAELKRRGWKDSSSPKSQIGVWNPND